MELRGVLVGELERSLDEQLHALERSSRLDDVE
jgi:hypothetical protein